MLYNELKNAFAEEKIDTFGTLAYADCPVLRPHLLSRLPFSPQSAVLFLVPYYAGEGENLSSYAVAQDYHAYMQGLFSRLSSRLFGSGYSFFGFADHSPLDERRAALYAGLGVLGDNGLLLSEKYGSYVFIGELLTDAPPRECRATFKQEIRPCRRCGACTAACPKGNGECLSAVTQKKGALTEEEKAALLSLGSVWGCDVCQRVCPHNRERIADGRAQTPIAFFRENRIPRLTQKALAEMNGDAFSLRAYSFRGREPLVRNLRLFEENEK